jgi:hypothetical protein
MHVASTRGVQGVVPWGRATRGLSDSCGAVQALQAAPSPDTGLEPQSGHSQVLHAEQRYCEPWVSEYRPDSMPTARRIRHKGQELGWVGGSGV